MRRAEEQNKSFACLLAASRRVGTHPFVQVFKSQSQQCNFGALPCSLSFGARVGGLAPQFFFPPFLSLPQPTRKYQHRIFRGRNHAASCYQRGAARTSILAVARHALLSHLVVISQSDSTSTTKVRVR